METAQNRDTHLIVSSEYSDKNNFKTDEAFDSFIERLGQLPDNLSGVALDMASMEIFEDVFRIRHHPQSVDPKDPIPLCTMNEKLVIEECHPFKEEAKSLIRLQAPKKTGMNIMELMDLDTWQYQAMKEALQESAEEEGKIADSLSEELRQQQQSG